MTSLKSYLFKPKWLQAFLLAIFMLILLSFTFVKREAIACESIAYLGFNEGSENVFFDDTIKQAHQNRIYQIIEQANHRISEVYGQPQVKPRYIVSNNTELTNYGINMTGMHTKAFTQECIFLGPRGQNVDVTTHELVHAEVSHRLSEFTLVTQLPIWFIEAVAIKLDYRSPFLLTNIELSPAEASYITKIFFNKDFKNTDLKNYQAARIAAESIDNETLYSNLEKLNQGESFNEVFNIH